MVGLSRVVLEVHFPADVVAGAGMGLLCGTLCRRQSQPLSWLERR
jgi:membrane-associated phospholipid phosphatase